MNSNCTISFVSLLLLILSCGDPNDSTSQKANLNSAARSPGASLIILGTIQDAGSPQIACQKNCCKDLFTNPDKDRQVVSLGLIDSDNQKNYIFEATPDIATQMKALRKKSSFGQKETPDGIFLTHAHIGHYTGLMYFGKEAMASKNVPVYTMPKMKAFLSQNGPWNQLVSNNNISIKMMTDRKPIQLTNNITVTPFKVPHRDEYSETVGYTITGPNKSALFIPDIDKWRKWNTDILDAISKVNYAFIDGTFYDAEEINNRDISEIPHPFIIESMALFKDLSVAEKSKIYFIHFNHTNPVLGVQSAKGEEITNNGFHIAKIYDVFEL